MKINRRDAMLMAGAATLLAEQPNASKDMILYAYKIGERAWPHITAEPPERDQ